MPHPAKRRFQITDAIVLIAATAGGLAAFRFWMSSTEHSLARFWPSKKDTLLEAVTSMAFLVIPSLSIMLFSWTAAILWLRLRVVRPRRRHLWCQPGFLACVATGFTFASRGAAAAWFIIGNFLMASPSERLPITLGNIALRFTYSVISFRSLAPAEVGAAILLIWLVTWAGGRCRSEPSWVDRSGRVLGAAWICHALISVSAEYFL